jgi:hypothetical protein
MNADEVRDIITTHAYMSGMKSGAAAFVAAGVSVLLANKYSSKFRTRLGYSGKMALPVSAFLGAFTLDAEPKLLAGARNPEKYLASLEREYVEERIQERHKLRLYQRFANFVYDHPYRSLIMMGVPVVGSIYAMQRTNHAIQASQQIMHTRIYGQGAVVCLLLASMGFNDYMRKRGRFEPTPFEEQQEQEE